MVSFKTPLFIAAGSNFFILNRAYTPKFVFDIRWRFLSNEFIVNEDFTVGLWDAVKLRLGQEVADNMNYGVAFQWMYPKCPPGQIQQGDSCSNCPAGSYSELWGSYYRDGAAISSVGCKVCPVCDDTCEFCERSSGKCLAQLDRCKISNYCRLPNEQRDEAPRNGQCQRCVPWIDQMKWTTTTGASCSDGNTCECLYLFGILYNVTSVLLTRK